jgi:micrococcal nuclease
MRALLLALALPLSSCDLAGAGAQELVQAQPVVIDGDTFRLGAETIRIANIDTPEAPPRARCMAEGRLAGLATRELGQLLASGDLTLQREGQDRYGRTLARVSVDGRDVGEALIDGGFAVAWAGRRADWCEAAE